MKKIVALLTAVLMVLGCATGLAENTKHERIYVVTSADGTIESITDSVRLENAGGLDEIMDQSILADIQGTGSGETFTSDGNTLTWKAGGKDITYLGTSDKAPALLPAVKLTLDGEEISFADLKDKTGDAVLTVSYQQQEALPILAVTVLPLPGEGITGLQVENAAVLSEMGRQVLVGWGVPGVDEKLNLPASFTASFHADHAALDWMMTFASAEPFRKGQGMIGSRLDFDPRAELQDVTALLTALQNGTPLPDVTGKAKDLPDKVNQLNISLQVLNTGAQMLAEGAASLNTGLKELSANSEALNTGADAVFAAILETANKQLAASGLAEAGIQVPELTAGNYADILGALVTKLEGATGTAAGRKAHDTLQGLLDQLNEVNSFVTGLKTYTAGVDRAAAGSAEISAGAAALHDNGTDALQAAILAAEKAAAGKLLPVLTGDAAALLDEYSRMAGQETGYDLHGEGWGTDALYVIRTDLQ